MTCMLIIVSRNGPTFIFSYEVHDKKIIVYGGKKINVAYNVLINIFIPTKLTIPIRNNSNNNFCICIYYVQLLQLQ